MAKKNIGVAPGTLVYTGKETDVRSKITLFQYNQLSGDEIDVKSDDQLDDLVNEKTNNWINVVSLNQESVIENVGNSFTVNRLLLEDVLNVNQLPKFEDFGEHIFVTLKMIRRVDTSGTIEDEHISFILGNHFLLSFQEKEGDVFEPVRQRLKVQTGKIRSRGIDYLLYALLDAIIDNYLLVTKSLEEHIENLEIEVFENDSDQVPKKIIALRNELNALRKHIQPTTILTQQLLKTESRLISEENAFFLADLNDHSNRAATRINEQKEVLASYMDLHLSLQGQRMNEIMKVLTIVAAIFIPLTFLAGIYGMNFNNMPELQYPLGYPILLGIMFTIGIALLVYFKRKKWL